MYGQTASIFQQNRIWGQWCYCNQKRNSISISISCEQSRITSAIAIFNFDRGFAHYKVQHCDVVDDDDDAGAGVCDGRRSLDWILHEPWANHSVPNWVWNKSHHYKTRKLFVCCVPWMFFFLSSFYWFRPKYGINHIWRVCTRRFMLWIVFSVGQCWDWRQKNSQHQRNKMHLCCFISSL